LGRGLSLPGETIMGMGGSSSEEESSSTTG